MPLDILMTLLSVILMGGAVLFPDDRIHQICGILLIVLWAIHIVLNRHWYGAILKGKYQSYRIMQLIVNCGVLICALFLMISGLLMAWFIPADWVGDAFGFARVTHLLASHWYYIFMAFHIGLHGAMLLRLSNSNETSCHSRATTRESLRENVGSSPTMTQTSSPTMTQTSSPIMTQTSSSAMTRIIPRIICILISMYGVCAFIIRGLWKYMFGLQKFFFFDFEKGYFLFALDYISILVLFGTVSYYLSKLARGKK